MDTPEERITFRRAKLAEIEILMQQAEVCVKELADSYSEEHDGKFSSIHPRVGFQMMSKKLVELRRGFLRAKI